MKQLIRRLSRVADSSEYCLLRSNSRSSSSSSSHRHRRFESSRSTTAKAVRFSARSGGVPEGYLPVYVGEEMERFVVSAELLNHPIFMELLNKSAQEYGYQQKGVLRIPCHVLVFERVLQALRDGHESRDLLNSLTSDHDFF